MMLIKQDKTVHNAEPKENEHNAITVPVGAYSLSPQKMSSTKMKAHKQMHMKKTKHTMNPKDLERTVMITWVYVVSICI